MIGRILLDLDDVCNQMTMWFLHWVGCPVNPLDNSRYPIEAGYDIVEACNRLHSRSDWTAEEFWDAIPCEAWATVPLSQEFPWVLNRCVDLVGHGNILISTKPGPNPNCLAGKLEWIHANMPVWMHDQYEITPRKDFGPREDTLLIDDNEANIRDMLKAGGQGLLVPRPWNPLNQHNTRLYLESFFRHPMFSQNSVRR